MEISVHVTIAFRKLESVRLCNLKILFTKCEGIFIFDQFLIGISSNYTGEHTGIRDCL
jgi:hypothetical protein